MQTETAKTQDDLEDDRLQEFCDLYNEIARTPDAERRFAEALAILKTLTTCEFCEPPRADDRREFVAAAPAPEPTTIACAGGLGADDDNLQDRVLSDEEAEEFAAQLFDGFFKYDPKNDVLAAAVMKIVGKFACEDDSDVRENSMHALQIALYAWTDDCARRINAFADAAGAKLGHAA